MKNPAFYCDESHPVKRDGVDFFILGTIYCETDDTTLIENEIISLKEKYGYHSDYEIKWSKINEKNYPLISELIRYASKIQGLHIRIVVATNKDERKFTFALPYIDFYERMYELLIGKIININSILPENAKVYVDERNTHSKENLAKLLKRLKKEYQIAWNGQIVKSHHVQLIQIIDLFIGACSYEKLGLRTSKNKLRVIDDMKTSLNLKTLSDKTRLSASKYNVMVWQKGK
jgi:hypothetical protein